jgi:hypothetical protein
MVPGKYDITIYRGGTWKINLEAQDANGDPLDFSIYDEIRMQIRPSWIQGVPTGSALLELTKDNGRIILNGTQLSLTISAQDTTTIDFDSGRYDVELVKHVDLVADPPIPEEVVDKFLLGTVEVLGEITV